MPMPNLSSLPDLNLTILIAQSSHVTFCVLFTMYNGIGLTTPRGRFVILSVLLPLFS